MDKDKEIENLLERIEELKQQNKDLREMQSGHKAQLDWAKKEYEEKLKKELSDRKPYWSLLRVLSLIGILFFIAYILFLFSQLG